MQLILKKILLTLTLIVFNLSCFSSASSSSSLAGRSSGSTPSLAAAALSSSSLSRSKNPAAKSIKRKTTDDDKDVKSKNESDDPNDDGDTSKQKKRRTDLSRSSDKRSDATAAATAGKILAKAAYDKTKLRPRKTKARKNIVNKAEEGRFQCRYHGGECGKNYLNSHNRNRHENIVHKTHNSFKCKCSKKIFDTLKSLRDHKCKLGLNRSRVDASTGLVRKTSGIFKCRAGCDAAFNLSNTLRVHENVKHDKDGEFVCYCGEKCIGRATLMAHNTKCLEFQKRIKLSKGLKSTVDSSKNLVDKQREEAIASDSDTDTNVDTDSNEGIDSDADADARIKRRCPHSKCSYQGALLDMHLRVEHSSNKASQAASSSADASKATADTLSSLNFLALGAALSTSSIAVPKPSANSSSLGTVLPSLAALLAVANAAGSSAPSSSVSFSIKTKADNEAVPITQAATGAALAACAATAHQLADPAVPMATMSGMPVAGLDSAPTNEAYNFYGHHSKDCNLIYGESFSSASGSIAATLLDNTSHPIALGARSIECAGESSYEV